MPGIVVVGLQWGDEGKGKVVDLFSEQASHIVRAQGGNNAGHTIKVGEDELSLHLIPSGILHSHTHVYIAAGCLLDPLSLVQEIEGLEAKGISLEGRLHISPRCHAIFPSHCAIDGLAEKAKGGKEIGTTKRGIGPCASDKVARIGITLGEIARVEVFAERMAVLARAHGALLGTELDTAAVQDAVDRLLPYFTDVEWCLSSALHQDHTVLFEGAQGALLDTNYGSYPFVTSTCTLAGGLCSGAGVGPTAIDEVIGVLKAYTTRVGSGPLPTTMTQGELDEFMEAGDVREVGTTTGRARRIGWLDLVLARYACALNGVDGVVLTKLDVLDKMSEIKVCVGYRIAGAVVERPPFVVEDLAEAEPVYETLPGWQVTTREARTIRQLPENARKFIERIEDFIRVPITTISVGPCREETIDVDEEWLR